MRAWALLVAVVVGCGRVDFDPRGTTVGNDGDTSASNCAGMWMCDGFENGIASPWTSSFGNVTIVDAPVHAGVHALRAAPLVATNSAVVNWTGLDMRTTGDIFARAYYNVPGAWPADHVDLASLGAGAPNPSTVALQAVTGTVGAWSQPSNTLKAVGLPIPRDTWFCLEIHIAVSTSGAIEVFFESNLVASASGFSTLPAAGTGYINADFGVDYSPASQALPTVYVDDVVIGPTRVGCL